MLEPGAVGRVWGVVYLPFSEHQNYNPNDAR